MRKFKNVVSIILIVSLLLGMTGCGMSSRRRSRRSDRDRDRDSEQTDVVSDDELECDKSFGSYTIGYGWVEVDDRSYPPDDFTYCMEGNENSSTPPNNLRVLHDTNRYSEDEGDDFATAILQQLHGQAASYDGTAQMTEYGTFGENQAYRFDIECDEFTNVEWYIIGDHEYVMFSIFVYDEDEDDHAMDVAEEAVYSFEWD